MWCFVLMMMMSARVAMAGYDLTAGNMPWVAATEWKDSRPEANGYSTTSSGLRYRMLPPRRRSKGTPVARGEQVLVLYKLFLSTEMDDSTAATPAQGKHVYSQDTIPEGFKLTVGAGRVIPGFDEAVLLMKDGDRGRFLLPAKIGYGKNGQAGFGIPPNAELEYFLEVHRAGDGDEL
jgi:peptidyl-prolyl cis-trans isomerase A (cyclophilin A)